MQLRMLDRAVLDRPTIMLGVPAGPRCPATTIDSAAGRDQLGRIVLAWLADIDDLAPAPVRPPSPGDDISLTVSA